MKYMYFCENCNKVFKVGAPGKKVKCPKCERHLKDLNISDEDYTGLSAEEKAALKTTTEPDVKEPEIKVEAKPQTQPAIIHGSNVTEDVSGSLKERLEKNNERLKTALNSNQTSYASFNNDYLKVQIQSQILASDNFLNICKMSALKNDGVIDKDEARLLKNVEKLTSDYMKGLKKLI